MHGHYNKLQHEPSVSLLVALSSRETGLRQMENSSTCSSGHNVETSLCLVAYYLLIVFPSLLLNGVILNAFIKTRSIRTSTNLIAVHISITSLVHTILAGIIGILNWVAYLKWCNSIFGYILWIIAYPLQFTIQPMNFLLLSVAYYTTLKSARPFLTIAQVVKILIAIWILGTVVNIPLAVVYPIGTFTEVAYEFCCNFNTSLDIYFQSVNSTEVDALFFARDVLCAWIPAVLAILFIILSYCIIKKTASKESREFPCTLLLMPVLSAAVLTISLIAFLNLNFSSWLVPVVSSANINFSPDKVLILVSLATDTNWLLYACLLLYFNRYLRSYFTEKVLRPTWRICCSDMDKNELSTTV